MMLNEQILIIPALLTAILISYLAMPVIIRAASFKNVIDNPKSEWRYRKKLVPTLGGLGVLAAFIISFSVWGNANSLNSYPFLIAGLFILSLLSLEDEVLTSTPVKKLIIQLIAALELVIGANLVIENLYGFFGIYSIPWFMGVTITVLMVVGLINALHLIDGIDGLAGGVGIIASSIFGIWFWSFGFEILAILSFVLSGSLIGFLIFNIQPAKIFLGETGSMALGYVLAFLALQFINVNGNLYNGHFTENAHIFSVAVLIIPVINTLRITFAGILNGENPFTGGHNHIYHQLLREGIPRPFVPFSLWISNLVVIAFAFLFIEMETNLYAFVIFGLGSLILPVVTGLHKIIHRQEKRDFNNEKNPLYEYDTTQ